MASHPRVDLPPFPSSSMDGYAVRAGDTPGVLPIVGHSAAGRPAPRSLGAGEAIEISTGAVVPEGADAVDPGRARRRRAGRDRRSPKRSSVGDNIRRRGGDVAAGDEMLAAGNVLTAARVGALAACGIETIASRRAPRVTILVTGTELRPPGEALEPGQIYESNGIMLERRSRGGRRRRRAARAGGGHRGGARAARSSGRSRPTSSSPRAASRSARTTSSAGSRRGSASRRSSGASRCVRASRSRSASAAQTLVFGLPGNPLSSLVGALLFVRPRCARSRAHPDPAPPFRPGTLAREVRPRPGAGRLRPRAGSPGPRPARCSTRSSARSRT